MYVGFGGGEMDLRSHRSHARSCRSQFPVFEWGEFQGVGLLLRGNIELYILGSILQARDQSGRDATHPTRDQFNSHLCRSSYYPNRSRCLTRTVERGILVQANRVKPNRRPWLRFAVLALQQ